MGRYHVLIQRSEDRKWKQVEFLLDLNQKFIQNPDIKECLRKLDDTLLHAELQHIFTADRIELDDSQILALEKFKYLCQFFGNLDSCRRMNVISLDQINLFGWYLYRIGQLPFVRTWCEQNGFERVVILADDLARYVYSKLDKDVVTVIRRILLRSIASL